MKIIATNKKAYHNYFIEDTFCAGIMLVGSEVKSVRKGSISLNDGFVLIKDNEIFLKNVYIAPYEQATSYIPDSRRTRKLLLNKKEILKIANSLNKKGYALIPTKVYFKGQLIKIEIALCKGKKLYDKRAVLHEKDIKRETDIFVKKFKQIY